MCMVTYLMILPSSFLILSTIVRIWKLLAQTKNYCDDSLVKKSLIWSNKSPILLEAKLDYLYKIKNTQVANNNKHWVGIIKE